MRRCPCCGANGIERRVITYDPDTPWYNCPCCKNEFIMPDHVAIDDSGEPHEDVAIAGWWPGLNAFAQLPASYDNEVKDLGGESIFWRSAYERRKSKSLAA